MKVGKRFRKIQEDKTKLQPLSLDAALAFVKEHATAKFDETVEMVVRLGVDPKYADQMVRGTVVLPHGTGKTVRVLVLAKGEKVQEAEKAGADFVGGEDLVAKIRDGWTEFDRVITTPDMMGEVGKLGKILGPSRAHAQRQGRDGDLRPRQGGLRVEGRARSSSAWTRRETCTRPWARPASTCPSWSRTPGPSWTRSTACARRRPRGSTSRRSRSAPPWGRAFRWIWPRPWRRRRRRSAGATSPPSGGPRARGWIRRSHAEDED